MDRQTSKAIAAEAVEALMAVADKYGCAVERGSASFDTTSTKIQFAFSEIGEDGIAMTREAETFKQAAYMYGLKPEDLGKKFTSNGHTYTITGLNTRARKMPIQATREDGATYKFTADQVMRSLGRNVRKISDA